METERESRGIGIKETHADESIVARLSCFLYRKSIYALDTRGGGPRRRGHDFFFFLFFFTHRIAKEGCSLSLSKKKRATSSLGLLYCRFHQQARYHSWHCMWRVRLDKMQSSRHGMRIGPRWVSGTACPNLRDVPCFRNERCNPIRTAPLS